MARREREGLEHAVAVHPFAHPDRRLQGRLAIATWPPVASLPRLPPFRTTTATARSSGKTVKNRLHFDLRPLDQRAQVNRLIARSQSGQHRLTR